ncbi:MAG: cbb3-type cytochrome c oxidase subunit I [Thermoplasmata archaeon]
MSELVHPQDKRLIIAFFVTAIGSIAGGGVMALTMVGIKVPAIPISGGDLFYQALTAHAMLMFVYWLSFIQAALMIGAVTALLKGRRFYSLRFGWVSFALMFTGLTLNMYGVFSGANVLYTAFPPLTEQFEATPAIYLGYIFLAIGALLLVINALLTIFGLVENKRKLESWKKMINEIHIATFATMMGIIMIIAATIMAINLYVPAFLSSIGVGSINAMDWRMSYHTVFHVVHYVPAMVLIGVCYVLVEVSMEAKSVYSKKVAKGLFILYPVTVPPTFLYHLLADPGISPEVKSIGSALALLVGLPTILHMFIIMGMMETRIRSAGHNSLFGWMKRLPWKNPAIICMILGMLSMGLGGVLGYVLLQGQTAQLLHGTFAVAAYIHPMAAGGATLVYMGASYYMITGIRKRQLWKPWIARIQPYISFIGLFIFGIAGTIAGYLGAPRRTADVSYGGAAPEVWGSLINISVGLGGTLMVIGGVLFVLVILMTAFKGKKVDTIRQAISEGLEPMRMPIKREVKQTPASLVPGTIFIILVIIITIISYWIIASWSILFG